MYNKKHAIGVKRFLTEELADRKVRLDHTKRVRTNEKQIRILMVTIIILGIVMPLSRVDVVFCLGNYFRYSSVYKPLLVYFILEAIFIGSYFRCSPVDKLFLVYFPSVFVGCSLGSSFWYSPVLKPYLVNFSF